VGVDDPIDEIQCFGTAFVSALENSACHGLHRRIRLASPNENDIT
jgi:hypothetical protein